MVITVPGLGASDLSMRPLRGYLRHVGHRVDGWGLGRNVGDVRSTISPFIRRVVHTAEREGHAVDLVGWSLGGLLAREAAREAPRAVRRVITYGSPVGGPRLARLGVDDEARLAEMEARMHERERRRITVPVTAIYSKNDGVVAWEACIDRHGNDVEHVEVRSSHVGMGLDPDVWRIIAERLEAPVGA